MWGRIEASTNDIKINLDDYVLTLEDEFYSRIEKIAGDWRTALVVEPSGEDEERIGGESIEHHGIKAFVVKHFTDNKKIKQSDIITEYNLGDIIVDVYVRHHKIGDIAVEVETLYGTVLPAIKLRKRIDSRLEKGLKVRIIIPNPQFMIYFKEIVALRNVYRKKYSDAVEFYTLDIYSKRLVPFGKIKEILEKDISKH